MRHLSFALLLLAGCPTTALYSTAVDGLWLQRVKAGKYPTRAEVFRRWGTPWESVRTGIRCAGVGL